MAEGKLILEVVTPERDVVSEDVDFIELPGRDGYLGILPGHAPLLTELGAGVLTFRRGEERRYATAVGGFAEVLANRVIVLAELSELAEEIDVGRARAAQQRALKLLEEKVEQADFQLAQLALERSLIRLQAAAQAERIHAEVKHRPRGIAGGEKPQLEKPAENAVNKK
jgi:F-type H+-transporting ATPase subunit epsilon